MLQINRIYFLDFRCAVSLMWEERRKSPDVTYYRKQQLCQPLYHQYFLVHKCPWEKNPSYPMWWRSRESFFNNSNITRHTLHNCKSPHFRPILRSFHSQSQYWRWKISNIFKMISQDRENIEAARERNGSEDNARYDHISRIWARLESLTQLTVYCRDHFSVKGVHHSLSIEHFAKCIPWAVVYHLRF